MGGVYDQKSPTFILKLSGRLTGVEGWGEGAVKQEITEKKNKPIERGRKKDCLLRWWKRSWVVGGEGKDFSITAQPDNKDSDFPETVRACSLKGNASLASLSSENYRLEYLMHFFSLLQQTWASLSTAHVPNVKISYLRKRILLLTDNKKTVSCFKFQTVSSRNRWRKQTSRL